MGKPNTPYNLRRISTFPARTTGTTCLDRYSSCLKPSRRALVSSVRHNTSVGVLLSGRNPMQNASHFLEPIRQSKTCSSDKNLPSPQRRLSPKIEFSAPFECAPSFGSPWSTHPKKQVCESPRLQKPASHAAKANLSTQPPGFAQGFLCGLWEPWETRDHSTHSPS